MRACVKVTIRVIFIITITVLFFGIGIPYVLGVGWPKALGHSTRPAHIFRALDIMPGDTISETVRFHNPSSNPYHYHLVLVRYGDLWECDPGGNNLHYKTVWSADANQYLEPGETEEITIVVTLPPVTSNTCQGKSGTLIIRQGEISSAGARRTYECRPSPYAHSHSNGLLENDDLQGYICGRTDRPFLNLFYTKQR